MIVDEGEARKKLRACNLIVFVESEIKYKMILHKNIQKREQRAIFFKKMGQEMIVLLLAIYRGIDSV